VKDTTAELTFDAARKILAARAVLERRVHGQLAGVPAVSTLGEVRVQPLGVAMQRTSSRVDIPNSWA
jgi:hypothetical protein